MWNNVRLTSGSWLDVANPHATSRTPHGAARVVLAMSAWSVKTRRAPSRHCRDAKVYGHATTAMHDDEHTTPPRYLGTACDYMLSWSWYILTQPVLLLYCNEQSHATAGVCTNTFGQSSLEGSDTTPHPSSTDFENNQGAHMA